MKNKYLTIESANISRIEEKATAVCIAMYSMMMSVLPAFATSEAASAITEGVKDGLSNVYSILTAIVLPVGVIALAVCAVKIIWGNQKSAEEGKSAIIRIVIALALIFLAPVLIQEISGWFQGKGAGASSLIFGTGTEG